MNIQTLPNEKKRLLDLDSFTTILLNYADNNFPNFIALYCLELDGYFNKNFQSTHLLSIAEADLKTQTTASGIYMNSIVYKAPSVG